MNNLNNLTFKMIVVTLVRSEGEPVDVPYGFTPPSGLLANAN